MFPDYLQELHQATNVTDMARCIRAFACKVLVSVAHVQTPEQTLVYLRAYEQTAKDIERCDSYDRACDILEARGYGKDRFARIEGFAMARDLECGCTHADAFTCYDAAHPEAHDPEACGCAACHPDL